MDARIGEATGDGTGECTGEYCVGGSLDIRSLSMKSGLNDGKKESDKYSQKELKNEHVGDGVRGEGGKVEIVERVSIGERSEN